MAPSSEESRKNALICAFLKPPTFKAVYEYYAGKILPADQYISNTLVREFQIPKEKSAKFLDLFLAGAKYVGLLSEDASGQRRMGAAVAGAPVVTSVVKVNQPSAPASPNELSAATTATCFVLMPFGGHFDNYCSSVYVPAITKAGLTPVRADGIFSSGQVINQICNEIARAKVLLAELTTKNTNVFYELGVAHRAGKPVILIAATMDDVPFDLRHLRVVIYDQSNPFWGEELMARITDFVSAALADPTESIPEPFRAVLAENAPKV